MSLVVPEELQNLESNCGVFAVWMVLQHCEIDIALDQLLEILGYEPYRVCRRLFYLS